MKKINACLILIIACLVAGAVAFVFPFYTFVSKVGTYGDLSYTGTISISGFGFLFGLQTTGTGAYANTSFDVIQNFGPLPLLCVIVGGLLLAIILVSIKGKANYAYFVFNALFILVGAAMMVLALYNQDLCNITLKNIAEYSSEGKGIGIWIAIFSGAGVALFGILDLLCIWLHIRSYSPELLDSYGPGLIGPEYQLEQQGVPLQIGNFDRMMNDSFDSCENELNILKDLFENNMIDQREYDLKRSEILAKYFREED